MALVFFLGFTLVELVLVGVIAAAAPSLRPSSGLEDGGNPLDLLLSLAPLALLIPISILATRVGASRRGMESVFGRFRWRFMLKAAPIVLGVYVLTGPALALLTDHEMFHVKRSVIQIVAALIIVLTLAPLQSAGEEYLFRGLPQQALGVWLKRPWLGILLPIPLFCLGHGYGWVGQFQVGVFALCAGLLVWKSGGLELPILLHASNNVTSMLMGPFIDSSDSLAQGDMSPLALIFTLPVTLGVTAYLWWHTNRTYGLRWRDPVTADARDVFATTVPFALQQPEPMVAPAYAMPNHPGAMGAAPMPMHMSTPLAGPMTGPMTGPVVNRPVTHMGGTMKYEQLYAVADRAALYDALRTQLVSERVDEVVGANSEWDYDLAANRLSFRGDRGQLSLPAQPVASVAPGPRTLLWGWAHPRGGDDAAAVKRLGERFRIAGLTFPEVPFAPTTQPAEVTREVSLLSRLAGCIATEAIRDTGFHYTVPADGGAQLVLWVRGLEGIPQIDMRQVVARTSDIVAGGAIQDVRSSLLGLAEHLGWYLQWADQHGSVGRLIDPAGTVAEFHFDPEGRLVTVTSTVN